METTPKEKAKELVEKFEDYVFCDKHTELPLKIMQIECAKIAVEEIIKNTDMYNGDLNPKWKFWNDVKSELNKM